MYEWLLFGHVLGVAVLLAGVGIYVVSVERLRQAGTVTELGLLVAAAGRGERIAFIGAAPLVAAGVTMAVRFWSLSDGWIATSIGVVVAMGLAGSIVDRRVKRLRAALRSAADKESPSTDLTMLARNPVLHASNRIYVALVVEILFLMSVKPSGSGIIWSLLTTAVLATIATWPLFAGAQEAFDREGGKRVRKRFQD
jgi:hypothetical protein